jgi:hypothetical protein
MYLCLQVCGYVGCFRSAQSWLNRRNLSPRTSTHSKTEWVWHIECSSQEHHTVTLTHSSLGTRINIPLTALIAGDVKLLPHDFYHIGEVKKCRSRRYEDGRDHHEVCDSMQQPIYGELRIPMLYM